MNSRLDRPNVWRTEMTVAITNAIKQAMSRAALAKARGLTNPPHL